MFKDSEYWRHISQLTVQASLNLEREQNSLFYFALDKILRQPFLEYDKGLTVKFSLCDRSKDKNVDENTAK